VVEHSPTLLARHGHILIRYAFLEEDGHVSVIAGRPRGE
jgi:hypothetical protein